MNENGVNITSLSVAHSDSYPDLSQHEVATVDDYQEDDGSQAIDLPVFDGQNHPTTVVNATNSSNIEIKPTTQFYAPVTIHQYLNPSTDQGVKPSTKKLCNVISSNPLFKLGAIGLIIIAVIIVAAAVSLTSLHRGNTNNKMDFGGDFTAPDETADDFGNDLHIFTRDRWGGRPILPGWENRTLVHPIKLVIIGHTAGGQCMSIEACSTKLQAIQSDHVSRNNYLDIGYNFLVGGQGNIYQALGWDIRNYIRNNSIHISYIGNYVYDYPTLRQRMGVQALLDRGVELGKLDKGYLLVGHNQVTNTESPGRFLKEEVKLWPHYYNGSFT